jgi:O-antigen/teichoic acid export membrane protein
MPADHGSPAGPLDRGRLGEGATTRPDLDALAGDLSTARLASGTRDNLVGAVVERILGIALFLTLPFLLSPRDLGAYYEVVALVTILVVLGVAGIDVAIVRFTALASEHRTLGEARSYLRAGVRITLGTSVALAVSLWVAAPRLASLFGYPGFAGPARLGAIAVPFLVGTFVLVAPARGLKLMRPSVLAAQVGQPATALVATLALVLAGLGLGGAVAGFTLAAIASSLLAAAMLVRLRLPGDVALRPLPHRALLRFALPVAGMTLAGTSLLWIDTLLLGAFRPAAEVATYAIIVRLVGIGSAVLLTVIQIFGPFVTQLVARGDARRLSEVLHTATRWVVLSAAPLLVFLALGGEAVLRIFHQSPSRGRLALVILAGAFLADAFTGPVGHVLTMSGRSWLNLANNVASLFCNVALNLALIPRFGLVGAALSWAVVIVGINVVRVLEVRAIFGVTPFSRSLARPALALVFASLVALGIGQVSSGLTAHQPMASLALSGPAFLAAYAAALTLLGPEPEDRLFWAALVRWRPRRATIEAA